MKIVFSSNYLRDLLVFRGNVMEELIKDGHQIIAVTPPCDANILPDFCKDIKFVEVEMEAKGKNPLNDIKYYRRLKSIYNELNPDYIFHFTIKPNIYGTLAAKSLRIPSTSIIAGLGHVYSGGGMGNAIARVMYKYAMRFPKKIITLNQDNYDKLLYLGVATKDKLILLPCGEGVNLDEYTKIPMPSSTKPVFLMLARVLYEKGYAEYVEAGESLKDRAIFRLMGMIDTHPTAVKLETIEQDAANGSIQYLGFSPDVKSQIKACHCIVLPSSYYEGLSRVLMEGLACGRPIITTNMPGCRETVDQEVNGLLIAPRDGKALTEACLRFIELTPDQRISMAEASRRKAEAQFDIKHVFHVYRSIISAESLKL